MLNHQELAVKEMKENIPYYFILKKTEKVGKTRCMINVSEGCPVKSKKKMQQRKENVNEKKQKCKKLQTRTEKE